MLGAPRLKGRSDEIERQSVLRELENFLRRISVVCTSASWISPWKYLSAFLFILILIKQNNHGRKFWSIPTALHLESGRVYNERWECVTPGFKLQVNTKHPERSTQMQGQDPCFGLQSHFRPSDRSWDNLRRYIEIVSRGISSWNGLR